MSKTAQKQVYSTNSIEEPRDFVKEYEELLQKMQLQLELIEFERGENKGHIRKFSLLEQSPTPVLTTHTF